MNRSASLDLQDRNAWRAWLEKNQATASEAWLVIQKKGSPHQGVRLDQATEEALCFGWIDSTLNRRDEHSYLLRFSPRRPDSVWSVSNIQRVKELEQAGLMAPAGLAAVRAGQENGQWQAALERERTDVIPEDLEVALRRREGAREAYRGLNDSMKKRYLYWLQSAKREETRQRRIEEIVRQVGGG
jgi:uncharacterized protein YdeI (YjbR/CyaY-like superfamily)